MTTFQVPEEASAAWDPHSLFPEAFEGDGEVVCDGCAFREECSRDEQPPCLYDEPKV